MTFHITLFMNFSIFLLVGLLYIFMPYLTRKTESFGISVPEEIYHSPRMQKIRKDYTKQASIVVLILFVITLYFSITLTEPMNYNAFIAGLIGLLVALFVLYLRFHFFVKNLKQKEQWTSGKKQVAMVDTLFRKRNLTYSNKYFIIPLVIILISIAFTAINYDLIGDQIPMQYDFEGNPTNFREKSPASVFWPNLMQALMLGLFVFINSIIAKAKQHINPADPEKSIRQNEVFRKKWSGFIIIIGTLMILMFSYTQLTFIYTIPPLTTVWIMMIFTLIVTIGAVYLTITVGQGGSRVKIEDLNASDEIDRDLDQYWKLGQFYVNPDDPAIFIEKRFGIGWTLNLGNKKGWLFLVGLLIIIALGIYFE